MKSLLLSVFFLALPLFAKTATTLNIRGYVYKDPAGYALIDPTTLISSPILTNSKAVEKELQKLGNFDSLMGSGSFERQTKSKSLVLESIDFVALRRLLGLWKSEDTLVNFIDYSHVSISTKGVRSHYGYIMTPSNGKYWRILLTDQTSVVLGSVLVENDKAEIEIYDIDTGDTTQRFDLRRVQ